MAVVEQIDLKELIVSVVQEVLKQLNITADKVEYGDKSKREKSAYQKTEQLLYNYMNFKKIVEERKREIEEIRQYGVPRSCAVKEYVDKGGVCGKGIVLEEESVEAAVANVERSVQGTVQALALIDKCMNALKYDPFYSILEMRYFEGRTQEDIADELGYTQKTISQHKARLIRELAMRLFPDQAIAEIMQGM